MCFFCVETKTLVKDDKSLNSLKGLTLSLNDTRNLSDASNTELVVRL